MSQNDMTIANQGFPATRADINSALQALASTSSGATEPSTMFANQLWFDTSANKLKIRNEANSAWYDLVEINESTGQLTVAFAAGAVATPSLTTTGDTNTGIFFPAADTIAFTEGGAEAMRINSSGNVGVGTTTPSSKLDVNGSLNVSGAVTLLTYVESVVVIGTVTTASTLSLTNGTVQTATLTASTACTFTMPTATAGKSFVLLLKQAATTGNGTATFTGVKFGTAGAPTITATAGKMDILTFIADGTNWYGTANQGYTP